MIKMLKLVLKKHLIKKNNMSSNDFLAISRSTFKVYHADAECGFNEKDLVATGKNLEDAILKAEEYQEKNDFFVEYGILFIN